MTISSIGVQSDNLQVFRAQNAFRKTLENLEKAKQSPQPQQNGDIKDIDLHNTASHGTYGASKSENEPYMKKEDNYVLRNQGIYQ